MIKDRFYRICPRDSNNNGFSVWISNLSENICRKIEMDNLHIVKQGAISIPLFTHCSHVLIVAKSIYDSSIIFGYFYLYKKRIERKIPYGLSILKRIVTVIFISNHLYRKFYNENSFNIYSNISAKIDFYHFLLFTFAILSYIFTKYYVHFIHPSRIIRVIQ